MAKEVAIFALGCFWKPQTIFSKVKGVLQTEVGYCGGKPEFKEPKYGQVCRGDTGHAESIKIEFDNKIVSYKELLEIFWESHDPTQLNRQGLDIGKQYRTVVFYKTEKQKKEALESRKARQKMIDEKIVTRIIKAKKFYPAEEYHQNYLEKKEKGALFMR